MSWLNSPRSSQQYLVLDRINGKAVVVMNRLGLNRGFATIAKVNFDKAVAQGFTFTPPTTFSVVQGFLQAKKEGRDFDDQGRRLPIREMCDLYIKLHGPDLKGGVNDHYTSPYHSYWLRMDQMKRSCWADKYADEIGKLDVRDFLSRYKTIGTKMRWIGVLTHMFNYFASLNEDEPIKINGPVRLPQKNPVKKWRATMKSHEKKQLPHTRVLTAEEWMRLRNAASPRLRPILEAALQRGLRKSDIRNITYTSIRDGNIKGLQAKTGEAFSVPVIANHTAKYDFTNFNREFKRALKKAGLLYPAGHPLHVTLKDLRRTGATWAYRKTKDLRGIQEFLGHENGSTTERYINIGKPDVKKIAVTLDQLAGIKPRKSSRRSRQPLLKKCIVEGLKFVRPRGHRARHSAHSD